MHNWHAIETEAEFRRREWQREIEAEMRLAAAELDGARPRGPHLPHVSLASLRAFAAARLPFASPLAPRRRSAAW